MPVLLTAGTWLRKAARGDGFALARIAGHSSITAVLWIISSRMPIPFSEVTKPNDLEPEGEAFVANNTICRNRRVMEVSRHTYLCATAKALT